MREIGVHFSVNRMLNMDAYKNRLEEGLTFFEFSYMLMQSYDFLHLYRKHNCKLQLGGSDQWSNILGGYDLVRKLEEDKVYAMTFKLLTTASGTKMGKSEKGTIWLDEEKTSPYELYQYMRNVDDRDVREFLKLLTFMPLEEIEKLTNVEGVEINKAKEVLAFEVTKLIHGEEKAEKPQEADKALFAGGADSDNIPSTQMDKTIFEHGMGIVDLLRDLGLVKSNSEARRLIKQNGISIDNEKVKSIDHLVDLQQFNNGKILVRKGKKVYHQVEIR